MISKAPDRLGRARLVAIVAAVATAAFVAAPSTAAADVPTTAHPADAPTGPPAQPYPVVAAGLDNPRQLTFDPDGNLYVAESGHGGDGACIPSADTPGAQACFGTTGAITKISAGGGQQRVVTGLPSLAVQEPTQGGQLPGGAQATGPSDVAVQSGDRIDFTVGLGSDPANRASLAASDSAAVGLGTLSRFHAGALTDVADIAAFESASNPVPPSDAPDSNPNAVLEVGSDIYVVDAGGNDLLHVDQAGTVSLVTTFPSVPTPGCAPPPVAQAVPTSVVRGLGGDLYVSELTGFPFCEGAASIYRVHIGDDGTGTATVYASGLTNVTDLAFGPDGTLYAVEIAQHGLQRGPIGAVVAIPAGGGSHFSDYHVVAAGLFAPYGIALKDGFAYVTTGSILPSTAGGGQVIAIPLGCGFPDVPAGSPFRIDICALASAGFVNGYADGTFRPTATVSRQAFAAFLGRIHGYTGPCFDHPSQFPDVPDSSPFCEAINRLAALGVIRGHADGTFRPAAAVSRQAAAAYLWRDDQAWTGPVPVTGDAPPTATDFPDVPQGNIFSGDIQFGADNHLINGYADGTFRPTAPVSRQAAAALIYRLGQLEAGPAFPTEGTIRPVP